MFEKIKNFFIEKNEEIKNVVVSVVFIIGFIMLARICPVVAIFLGSVVLILTLCGVILSILGVSLFYKMLNSEE